MLTITPNTARSIRSVPLSEENFSVELQETSVLTVEGNETTVTLTDATFKRSTEAIARIDGQVFSTPLEGSPQISYRSADLTKATVNSDGRITTTGSGLVDIFAETPWLRRKVTHEARTIQPATVDIFQEYLADTLGLHIREAVAALAASGGHLPLFSTKNHDTVSYSRNPNNWFADYDFTGVSPWNSNGINLKGGTPVTPRHLIHAWHYEYTPPVGTTLRFVTEAGSVIVREVTARARVGATDIGITRLDADLPASIAVYPVLPANWRDYLVTVFPARIPIISLDQEQNALCRDMTGANSHSIGHQNATGDRSPFTETLIIGDSGQPNFMPINDELVFLGCHHTPSAFPHLASHIAEVNSVISDLGGGGQLTTADLNGFTDFS